MQEEMRMLKELNGFITYVTFNLILIPNGSHDFIHSFKCILFS